MKGTKTQTLTASLQEILKRDQELTLSVTNNHLVNVPVKSTSLDLQPFQSKDDIAFDDSLFTSYFQLDCPDQSNFIIVSATNF